MTTKNRRANARKIRRIKRIIMGKILISIFFLFTIGIFALTIHTLAVGWDLISISNSNLNTETWRINPEGIKAANAVYENNAQIRDAIYNSDFWYTRFISTASLPIQLLIGLGLLTFSGYLITEWYNFLGIDIYIASIKEAHRKVKERNTPEKFNVRTSNRTV